jgi:hypothetical protein
MDKVDLLQELSSGEDEFDVDLMACGCRMIRVQDQIGFENFNATLLATKYQLSREQILDLIDAILATAEVDTHIVENLARQIQEHGTWNKSLTPNKLEVPKKPGRGQRVK